MVVADHQSKKTHAPKFAPLHHSNAFFTHQKTNLYTVYVLYMYTLHFMYFYYISDIYIKSYNSFSEHDTLQQSTIT